MDEKQFERLLNALFDIKAGIRDLRNDLRRDHAEAQRTRVTHLASKGRR